jgi:hypothetical protein
MNDQALGLRDWAQRQRPPSAVLEQRVLMLIGAAGLSAQLPELAQRTLQRWQGLGHGWVGDVSRWRVVPLAPDTEHLHTLARQQRRWGLWVGGDQDAYRRAYLDLRHLSEAGGPKQLLLLHPGIRAHRMLLDNLRQAAARFLGVHLMLVPE